MTGTEQNLKKEPRIVGFVCNWSAYGGVEMAGVHKREYPASVSLVRVACLGRLHPGLILRAFELGADGVILIGCPPKDCYYESGMEKAKEVFAEVSKVIWLLGIDRKRLALVEVPLGGDDILVKRVSNFVRHIREAGSRKRRSEAVSPA